MSKILLDFIELINSLSVCDEYISLDFCGHQFFKPEGKNERWRVLWNGIEPLSWGGFDSLESAIQRFNEVENEKARLAKKEQW